MRKLIVTASVLVLLCGFAPRVRADEDKGAAGIVDKGIEALGGKEKLTAVKAVTWSGKGKITIQDSENEFHSKLVAEGLDRFRGEFEAKFNADEIKGVTVVDGDKAWRQIGDTTELDKEALANQKRDVYLQIIPAMLVQLKDKEFKLESAGEDKVNDKPAAAVKVTPPDGKEFTLWFDKESGLPVKMVAKVIGWGGEEFTQQTTFADYKDFDGIKKATKVDAKRDGEKFIEYRVTEFKVLDKAPEKSFDKPE